VQCRGRALKRGIHAVQRDLEHADRLGVAEPGQYVPPLSPEVHLVETQVRQFLVDCISG
jgi:hypothetical protein